MVATVEDVAAVVAVATDDTDDAAVEAASEEEGVADLVFDDEALLVDVVGVLPLCMSPNLYFSRCSIFKVK